MGDTGINWSQPEGFFEGIYINNPNGEPRIGIGTYTPSAPIEIEQANPTIIMKSTDPNVQKGSQRSEILFKGSTGNLISKMQASNANAEGTGCLGIKIKSRSTGDDENDLDEVISFDKGEIIIKANLSVKSNLAVSEVISTGPTGESLTSTDGNMSVKGNLNVKGGFFDIYDNDVSNYLRLKSANLTSNVVITFPNSVGSANQSLRTDGSGNLFWSGSTGGMSSLLDDTTPQLGGPLDVNGESITSTSNGNVTIAPNGSGITSVQSELDIVGNVNVNGNIIAREGRIDIYDTDKSHVVRLKAPALTSNVELTLPTSDGNSGQVLRTDGSGILSWVNQISDVVDDTTPQLGGALDVNGQSITSASNGNVTIAPNGSGITNIQSNLNVAHNIIANGGIIDLYDTNKSHVVRLKAPALTSNVELTLPTSDGGTGQVLRTDGSGVLSWVNQISDVVDDTTPQLGGALDVNGQSITSASNGNVTIAPNGSGITNIQSNLNVAHNIIANGGIIDLYDTNKSHVVRLKAPALTSNVELTLPTSDGNTDQFLQTNGSGVLTWADGGGSTIGTPNVSQPDHSNTSYTDVVGLSSSTTTPNAFALLDIWIRKYLVDTPPAPTFGSSGSDTSKISVAWTVPTQIELAFTNEKIPKITTIKIDYKTNASGTWSNTINTSSTTANALDIYVEGSGGSLGGTKWSQYGAIISGTSYDFRVYGENDQSNRSIHYMYANNISTASIGVPAAPTSFQTTSTSTTSFGLSWTKPADHDITTGGNQTTPFIKQYKIDFSATSSGRYGGLISDSGNATTSATNSSNSATTKTVSSLNPGTTYNLTVKCKNTQNTAGGSGSDGFGATSSAIAPTTSNPSAPAWLVSGDCDTINNISSLRSPYSSSGGYLLNGSTSTGSNLIRYANLGTLRTDSAVVRSNNTVSTTATTIGTAYAYGGLYSDYNDVGNTVSQAIGGFGQSAVNGTDTNGKMSLVISGDEDNYSGSSAGFWKKFTLYGLAVNVSSNYTASINKYSMQLKHDPTGVSAITTTRVDFYIDSLNNSPAASNVMITNTSGTVEHTSGVASLKSGCAFNIQLNVRYIAHNFLEYNRKHATVIIKTSNGGGTTLSGTLTISKKSSDNGYVNGASNSHYYFDTSDTYTTSTTHHNTSGQELSASSSDRYIQFNDFTISLTSSANNRFAEDLGISVVPYNLYGTGSTVTEGGATNPSNNASRGTLRVDTNSITTKTYIDDASAIGGLHVRSGTGQYASTFGATYDHTINIASDGSNTEMQLVNGYFYTPSYSSGYKNYTSFYTHSGSLPDYSGISADSSYRYVTFKYTGRISNASGCRVVFQNSSGFSSATPSDIQLCIKIINSGATSNNTAWLDANSAVSGVGVNSSNKVVNGTTCLSTSGTYTSTATTKYCYLENPTTGDLYVRLGIRNNSSKYIKYIRVYNNFA